MSEMSRRHVLAGLSVTAAGIAAMRSTEAASQQPGGRFFTLDDAFRRSNVVAAVASPKADRWALEIERPLAAPGPYGEHRASTHARSQIWLAGAQLETVRPMSRDTAWNWAPDFSPDGKSLAFLTSEDAIAVHLGVRTDDGEIRRFRNAPQVELFTILGDPTQPASRGQPFVWLDDATILYVAFRSASHQPDLNAGGDPVAREAAWRTIRSGGRTARIWNAASPTCGASNFLVRLDLRNGRVTDLFAGDVRGLSLSPDRRFAALLVASGHLDSAKLDTIEHPSHSLQGGDLLVWSELHLLDLERRKARRIDPYRSVGPISSRYLPVWSADAARFAVFHRQSYDETRRTYGVLEVAVDGSVSTHAASSQLDAEVVANLVVVAATEAEKKMRLARRPQLAGQFAFSPADHLRVFDGRHLYVFDGKTAHHLAPDRDTVLPASANAPDVPVRLRDGRLRSFGLAGALPVRWTFGPDGVKTEPLSLPTTRLKLQGINDVGDAIVAEADAAGTFFWKIGDSGTAKLRFSLNRHLAGIRQPRLQEVAYRNAHGEDRLGILALPPQHQAGQRCPVVVWAYPDSKPSLRGRLFHVNDGAAVSYPFQLLLAAGFAVFQADFPVGPFLSADGKEREEPADHILAELKPCIAMLQAHPDLLPGEIGFFGHSNAGYVALMLAAHTHDLKAIVARSTFPDYVATNVRATVLYANAACGGFVVQGERYYTEAQLAPYALGGPFWRMPDKYLRASSLFSLHQATTPVLFIQGELDVTPQSIEQAYAVLQANGVPAELAYYRGETHNFNSPANIRDSLGRSVAWFEKYLRKS